MSTNNRKKNRKRNKSSPINPSQKKYRTVSEDRDSEGSAYFDTIEDSDSEVTIKHSNIPPTTKMATSLSHDDLKKLGAMLILEIKEDLIQAVKGEIQAIVKAETKFLTEEMSQLKKVNDNLRAEINDLTNAQKYTMLELDELDQYGRRMCLNVSGIRGDTGDFNENIERKILDHASSKGLQLTSGDIDKCHRLGSKTANITNRKVIVKFTNSKARDRVYSARKTLGNGIFVQENLTRYRERLSFEARQLVRSKKLTKTWVAGCRVYGTIPGIDTNTDKKVLIKDMDIVECIREGRPV